MTSKRSRKYKTREQKLNPQMTQYPGMNANAVKAVRILNKIKVNADDRDCRAGDTTELQED